ncbi:Uncharacterized membrane protein YdjX, TVP38/TMEM64 family, SNARE-associated domain [Colwellia chukchiensis]|uniref:TVP38/TMEM64 family membrane protein n=1 Tax=Colwellia chukchiensis TaxID=641665 RepID=A0A1H7QN09_9GAMM|nr:VTT domain-containing protein [Colwellia chukchiensis]SEL49313.1 Uncharacterized membrane protein YdjX, TVP38/TMEM64 family, SNARE-associated domain [Colwellia chukchiensis]
MSKTPLLAIATVCTLVSLLLAMALLPIVLGNYGDDINRYLNTLLADHKYAALLFTVIVALAMALGLPRQIAAVSAGYLFGASFGTLLATLAASIGCALTFILARHFFAKRVQKKYPLPVAKVRYFFSRDTFLKALIIRLVPAGSNFLTNLLAGTANTPLRAYLLGSTVGFIPQMTIFSLMGAGLRVDGQQQLVLSLILLLIALALSGYLYKKSTMRYLPFRKK